MIIHGDALHVPLADCSVDAIVTDPPYGLEFMGKEWDKLASDWNKGDPAKGYDGDGGLIRWTKPRPRFHAGYNMQLWHTQWLTEAYRVLKPGASMLVMGGTRTFHRLMCAMEDAGFIIKDTIMWVFGSGFPKAQEASVLVDAKILGISTKEVNEKREIIGFQKDIGHIERGDKNINQQKRKSTETQYFGENQEKQTLYIKKPLTPEGEHWHGFKIGGIKPAYEPIVWAVKPPEGSYVNNVLKWGVGAERNAGLEGMEEKQVNDGRQILPDNAFQRDKTYRTNTHPTVKPIALFEWLIKLVTREGQTVLDPFLGSGTTAIAAHNTGRKCIGIEKEGEYIEIAKRRIAYWESQPRQMELKK